MRDQHVFIVVNRSNVPIVLLLVFIGVIDDFKRLNELFEPFNVSEMLDTRGFCLVRVAIVGDHLILVEVLEDEGGPIMIISDVLLNVLDLLVEEELILLRQVIQVDLIGQIQYLLGVKWRRPVIFLLLL